MTPEPDQAGSIAADDHDERQLCVNCMAPNQTTAHFCTDCGAPLSSYAATGPFEHLFAEGHVYRQAAERPRSLFVVFGVWFIFSAMALAGMGGILLSKPLEVDSILIGTFFMFVSLAMIWRTTRNYLARQPVGKRSDAQE